MWQGFFDTTNRLYVQLICILNCKYVQIILL